MAKVLLVDDELTMVQMVADLLRADGHEVFPFTSLSAAVAGMTAHQPDLVVTDLYLDKTNAQGLEIIKKARSLSPPHDAARSRALQPASSQAGDWHDVTGHHRYYGSSAINGGERIVEDRRPRFVNLCGF